MQEDSELIMRLLLDDRDRSEEFLEAAVDVTGPSHSRVTTDYGSVALREISGIRQDFARTNAEIARRCSFMASMLQVVESLQITLEGRPQ